MRTTNGVARRRTGDSAIAEEVAQNVFVLLAKKAPALAGRPGLGAWLHRAAVLESRNFTRSEMNRRRMMDAYQEGLTQGASASEPAVEALRPVLDEAFDRLGEPDRRILVMHFFEGVHVDWGLMMAAAVLMTLPLAILFMLVQRHLIVGFGAGAVKG